MRQCILEQDFPDHGNQTIEPGLEKAYCVDDWQSLKLEGDFSTNILQGIYLTLDKCVPEDLPEDEACYSEEELDTYMSTKLLKIIVKKNYIESESYENLISDSVKTVKTLHYDPVIKRGGYGIHFIKIARS